MAASIALIFLPSRPIILPFISSGTTETVLSEVCSTAHFWIARLTISLAFLWAFSRVLSSTSLIIKAASCFTSSSKVAIKFFFASSVVKREILSSSRFSFSRIRDKLSSFSLMPFIREIMFFSFLSKRSTLRSRFSCLSICRFSRLSNFTLRSFVSCSNLSLSLWNVSLASKTASLFLVSASLDVFSIILFASSSAEVTFSLAIYFRNEYPISEPKSRPLIMPKIISLT
ncbi:hypothetical protein ES703_101997 [subsurface metagenome]